MSAADHRRLLSGIPSGIPSSIIADAGYAMADKVRENRVRRKAERQGLQLQKSRRRDTDAIDFGGFMLVEAATSVVVMGATPHAYAASLEEIEVWLAK